MRFPPLAIGACTFGLAAIFSNILSQAGYEDAPLIVVGAGLIAGCIVGMLR